MINFVLIPGSWHDAAPFDPVVSHLKAKGHRAVALTLAGHGKGAEKKGITHDDCVKTVTDYLVQNDARDVVLMGHSFGGTVISRVAQAVPDRIKRLIFWNAFVLNDGESLMDAVPQHYRDLFEGLAAASGDDTVMLPFPVWREAFINDASLELAQETYDRLSPEPLQPLRDKLDLKTFYELIQSGKIACSYINCTEDIALPQGPDTGWHPRMSNRLGLFRLVQMPGSHEVCFSDPIGLGDALIAAGRD